MAKEPEQIYTAKNLVEKLKISDKYLRKLMTVLSKTGFISSRQGREGGYSFAKSTNEIFVNEIIDAVEGLDKYMGCVMGFDECSDENPCALHNKWADIRDNILTMFKNTSIAELAESNTIKF
jgi:Rrf2 family transcriptional regulator, iron-sulfur cluster assembly transcription factor